MSDLPPGFVVMGQLVDPGAGPDTGPPSGFEVNAPPPGVMIHEANRSYIVGPDGTPSLSVDTTGMNPDQRVRAAANLTLSHHGIQAPSGGQPNYTSSILPVSTDAQGNPHFDWNSGIVGKILNAMRLPGDVASGQTPILNQNSDVPGSYNPDLINRSLHLAGIITPAAPPMNAGEMAGTAFGSVPQKRIAPPTAQELKDAATAGYTAVQNSGVEYRPAAVADMANTARTNLEAKGLFDINAPQTHAFLNRAAVPPASSPDTGVTSTFANLKSLREALGTVARETKEGHATPDAVAAKRTLGELDAFFERADPQSLASGSPEQATAVANTLRTANQNYGAAQRSNDITGALDRAVTGISERAALRAQAANSGRNLDNTIRQRVLSLLSNSKGVQGFSDDELAALRDVVDGSAARNSARYLGNLLGGGGGLGQFLTGAGGAIGGTALGTATGNPILGGVAAVAPMAAGIGARGLANTLANRSLNQVDQMVRMRSPLYDAMLSEAPAPLSREATVLRSVVPGLAAGTQGANAFDLNQSSNNTVYALARIIASGKDAAKTAAARQAASRLPPDQQAALALLLTGPTGPPPSQ